jgi:two-component system sensor histidine kinase SenX3
MARVTHAVVLSKVSRLPRLSTLPRLPRLPRLLYTEDMRQRKSAVFFLILGIGLIVMAGALNVGWILLSVREAVFLVLGILLFAALITGVILNTIFLLREIRRNERSDAILNAITHELKTPLASIKLYLETLKTRDVSEEKREEFYDIMLADSNRLLSTVDQVLLAGKSKEKQLKSASEEFSLGQLILDAASLVSSRNKLPDDAIRVTLPAEEVVISGIREQFESVMLNLIENAVKYAREKEPRVQIKLRESLGGKVDVLVKDNGVGLESADLKKIFERFYRAPGESSMKIKGTGLGLFIAKTIIENHGGRIYAESKGLGKGATFIVRLPRKIRIK